MTEDRKMLEEAEVNRILEHVETLSEMFVGESETVIINTLLNFTVKICMHFQIPAELIVNEFMGCMVVNRAIKIEQDREASLMPKNETKH